MRPQTLPGLRSVPIRGSLIDLLPYAPQHFGDIIRLRNQERARYALHQEKVLTLDDQRNWYEAYVHRSNDLTFVVATKDGTVIGTNALYDIDTSAGTAELGRLVIDEERGMEAPYVLEAELRLLDLAFDTLGLTKIVCTVRHDNHKTLSMNLRFGASVTGQIDIRGVPFDYLELPRDKQHEYRKLYAIIRHWERRSQRG